MGIKSCALDIRNHHSDEMNNGFDYVYRFAPWNEISFDYYIVCEPGGGGRPKASVPVISSAGMPVDLITMAFTSQGTYGHGSAK